MTQRKALLILGALVAVVLTGAIERTADLLLIPWVFADPPLFGHWHGQLTAGNGAKMRVAMEVRRIEPEGRECWNCNQLEGTIVTCDTAGTIRRYRLSGSPRDRRARTVVFGAIPQVQPPPDGLELDGMRGQWDRADTLTLQAGFHWRLNGGATSSTGDPATRPVPVRMTRAPDTVLARPCE